MRIAVGRHDEALQAVENCENSHAYGGRIFHIYQRGTPMTGLWWLVTDETQV